jgi:predicted phosphate transport protein (TIGR00153 family)
MGVGSILRFFLPQDDKFLPYFEQSADNLKEAGTVYASLAKANSREEIAAVRDKIKKLEHVGDKLTHSIFEELNRSFITPFDREDIYSLTKSMDDVLDLMDHVADILVLYRIDKVEDGMTMLLEVTRRAISDIHKSVHTLRSINYDKVREHIISVHALENEGDRLYRHFIGNLYAEEREAIRLMKYSSIYNELEHTIDKCEDLMNAIESIILKQA